MAKHLIAIVVELGGKAGERMGQQLSYRIRDNTLLSLFSRVPLPAFHSPTVLGVDDFAFAKRQSYGTILVDLERQLPIALLKDREANTLAQWLEQHPSVAVLSRDRSATYRSGMDQGAPQAIQVADRFHLLHWRRVRPEQVQQVLQAHSEGSSLRGISRITGLDYNTVVSLVRSASTKAQLIHNGQVEEIETQEVSADEMWSFVQKNRSNAAQKN